MLSTLINTLIIMSKVKRVYVSDKLIFIVLLDYELDNLNMDLSYKQVELCQLQRKCVICNIRRIKILLKFPTYMA